MKATIVGFNLGFGQGIDCNALLDELMQTSGDEFKFDGFQRLYRINQIDNGWWTGIFITIKNHRNFLKLQRKEGRIRISVGKVEEGKELMHFNTFLINGASGKGAYMSYRGSCSLTDFFAFLSGRYRRLRTGLINEEMKNNANLTREDMDRKYAKQLHPRLIVRKAKFAALVAELDRVNTFEFPIETVDTIQEAYRPLREKSKAETRRFTFSAASVPAQIGAAISDFAQQHGLIEGKVTGKIGNHLRVIKLIENADILWEGNFDQLTEGMEIDVEEYLTHPITQHLIDTVNRRLNLF